MCIRDRTWSIPSAGRPLRLTARVVQPKALHFLAVSLAMFPAPKKMCIRDRWISPPEF